MYALFGVFSSAISIGIQRNAKKHPIKLVQERAALSRFFLEMPSYKQKKYFFLGILSGLIAGVCFGAGFDHNQKSKNQK